MKKFGFAKRLHSGKAARGFSLIELQVALTIFVIAITVSAMMISAFLSKREARGSLDRVLLIMETHNLKVLSHSPDELRLKAGISDPFGLGAQFMSGFEVRYDLISTNQPNLFCLSFTMEKGISKDLHWRFCRKNS